MKTPPRRSFYFIFHPFPIYTRADGRTGGRVVFGGGCLLGAFLRVFVFRFMRDDFHKNTVSTQTFFLTVVRIHNVRHLIYCLSPSLFFRLPFILLSPFLSTVLCTAQRAKIVFSPCVCVWHITQT